MSDNDRMHDYLAEHPRMIGALFTLLLLLSQAGSAAASSSSLTGP
ncbi:DUF7503 family protein [Natrialbaceae archaeon AArc-T1-2]|nr:hypothetical protein [Natrialbaceae archaeon AArc-T1-2]WIV66233.1 hypothetical protein QQ977_11080 [Natrialbaceae archaeon AArc-T1-2]